ncbi:IMPACT family protein [Microvirga mediterraneensis]|uniref:YigZ family protein n=1 Tax=Microvirga mediterraneensis TaxID=2754695 RepID=A0A838BWC7_9HYPH|nr:YigZ family protein [Microvirga mediterraneensis]MBA1159193.1 YigZ family protein [Microvirga mediterraneensis]
MLTLERPTSLEQIIKKSRFVATGGPVAGEQAAKDFIAAHADPGANHNCWAWRVGQSYRSSDDGEPSGTAGKPILQAIDRLSLDNVAVVVTRWFGGVLLGSGGLIRAYGGTAATCLRAGKLVAIVAVHEATITVTFSDLALVQARLASSAGVQIRQESFTETGATLTVGLPEASAPQIVHMIMDITSGRASIVMDPCTAI